jgi:hypothetical protein
MVLQVMQILGATEEPCSDLNSNSGAAGHAGAEIESDVWVLHNYLQWMEERDSSEVSLFFMISH